MHWQYTHYALPLFLTTVLVAALVPYIWRRRTAPGALALLVLMVAAAEWSLGYALEILGADLATKLLWVKVQYLGTLTVTPAWVVFVLRYTERGYWLTWRNRLLLAAVPVATLIVVWTNDWHGLMWNRLSLDTSGPLPGLQLGHGPWYWVWIVFSYLALAGATTWLLVTLARRPQLFGRQVATLLFSSLLPWLAHWLYLAGVGPFANVDPTPAAFALSGIALAVSLARYRLLDITPLARRAIVGAMSEGVLMLDVHDRIVDVNPAAERLTGFSAADVVGQPAALVFSEHAALFGDQSHAAGTLSPGTVLWTAPRVADGEPHHYELRISPLTDERGNPLGRLALIHDITDRAEAEAALRTALDALEVRVQERTQDLQQQITERIRIEGALRQSEEQYRLLAETVTDIIWVTDLNLRFTYVSPSVFAVRGFTPEEVLKQSIEEVMPPDSLQRALQLVAEHLPRQIDPATRDPNLVVTLEMENYCKDGRTVPVEARICVMYSAAGEPVGLLGVTRDITERKRTEEALRESEERYRHIFENSPIGIYQTTPDGRILAANPATVRLLGYSSFEELARRDLEQEGYAVPTERQEFKRLIEQTGQISGHQAAWKRKDGSSVHIRENARAIRDGDGRILYYDGTAEDISDRVRAEEEVRRRNRELALLNRIIATSAGAQESTAVLDTACRELGVFFAMPSVSASVIDAGAGTASVVASYRLYGWTSAVASETVSLADDVLYQYLRTSGAPLVIPDAEPPAAPAPGAAEVGRRLSVRLDQRGVAALLAVPLVVHGALVGWLCLETNEERSFSAGDVGLARSIADEVAGALDRLRLDEDRRRLSTVIEQAAESVLITDITARILYVNPAFERLTGYVRADVLGQNPRLLKSGVHDSAFYRELWATVTAGKVWHGRMTNRGKDGSTYTVDTTVTPVRDEGGHIVNYAGLQRDITRELQLEEQYRQAQKMEAVGLLAGGVAHDFNNMLTVINGFSELLQRAMTPDSPQWEMTDQILTAGGRAAELVRQLLAFSRKQMIEPRVLDLNCVVTEMEKMLRRLIGEHILVTTLPAPDLWPVRVDPAQIQQVLMNLAVNARDAMPCGGRLAIETANVVLDEAYVRNHMDAQPGEHVLLTVSDTGTGMNEDVQAHIFEPFFTTKELGKGTGLGLATVYGIVRQSGGHIGVYSEEGRGTAFKVYLPRVGGAEERVSGESHPPAEMASGRETVLVVEDDVAVRTLTTHLLRASGYVVLEALDGQAAWRLVQAHPGRIHLLLTDVVMPGMSGPDLAERLKELLPELKVLFMSGYTDGMVSHHSVLEPGMPFISKPFQPGDLARKVRQVLDA